MQVPETKPTYYTGTHKQGKRITNPNVTCIRKHPEFISAAAIWFSKKWIFLKLNTKQAWKIARKTQQSYPSSQFLNGMSSRIMKAS